MARAAAHLHRILRAEFRRRGGRWRPGEIRWTSGWKCWGRRASWNTGTTAGPCSAPGRLAAVLREAARRIDYGRKLPRGRGIGLAAHFTFGGYTAHAIEVAAQAKGWRIERCICVSDVGQVVNPSGVQAQLEGGTVDGISTALGLEITVENGRIQQSNFDGYPHPANAGRTKG